MPCSRSSFLISRRFRKRRPAKPLAMITASANGGARTVYTHLTRLQGGYACSTTIVGEINGVDQSFVGNCTLTYLGP